jgi:hypothetical protein
MKRKKVKFSPLGLVLKDVIAELDRQRTKWGEQNHSPEWWLAILGEEVGEANKAALESHFKEHYPLANWGSYVTELIQVAAVAISAIESIRRKGNPK